MDIELTYERLTDLQNGNGGYKAAFLKEIGVAWPPEKGWKNRVASQRLMLTEDQYKELTRLQSVSIKQLKDKEIHVRPKTKDQTIKDTYIVREKYLDMPYAEFLKSDYWKNLRAKLRKRVAYQKCRFCKTTKNIELHHTSYRWIGTLNEPACIIPLCRTHHQEVHDLSKKRGISVRVATRLTGKKYRKKQTPKKKKKRLPQGHKNQGRWEAMRAKFGYGNI